MAKILTGFVFVVLLGVVGMQVYRLYGERSVLQREFAELESTVQGLEADNHSIAADIAYYQKPENLMQAVKSWFNYKKPGEKLYIIVPQQDAADRQSTP